MLLDWWINFELKKYRIFKLDCVCVCCLNCAVVRVSLLHMCLNCMVDSVGDVSRDFDGSSESVHK